MKMFMPIALLAILIIGCKGGDTTAATGGGSGSSSPTASATGTYNIKLNPKQGEKYSYVMKTGATGMNMEMGLSMTCEKVEGDKFTIVSTIDSVKMNGKDLPAAAAEGITKMKTTNVMDSTGKMLETKLEGAPPGTATPETPMTSFPAGQVKIGDTWDGGMKMQGADVKVKYKLVKVDDNEATIESTIEGLPGGMVMDGPTITVVELSTGMVVSTTAKMKMKGPDGKDVSLSTNMERK